MYCLQHIVLNIYISVQKFRVSKFLKFIKFIESNSGPKDFKLHLLSHYINFSHHGGADSNS